MFGRQVFCLFVFVALFVTIAKVFLVKLKNILQLQLACECFCMCVCVLCGNFRWWLGKKLAMSWPKRLLLGISQKKPPAAVSYISHSPSLALSLSLSFALTQLICSYCCRLLQLVLLLLLLCFYLIYTAILSFLAMAKHSKLMAKPKLKFIMEDIWFVCNLAVVRH